MVNRIKKIAEHWGLSPTAFADQIGLSRPIISHIFSERNRPSLEVVQKIGTTFPEIALDWLLYGKGEMLKKNAPVGYTSQASEMSKASPVPEVEEVKEKMSGEKVQKTTGPAAKPERAEVLGKKVVKVMLFYADQTFEAFEPNS